MNSLFDKIRSDSNSSGWNLKDNNNTGNSMFKGSQSRGFDATDREMGYQTVVNPVYPNITPEYLQNNPTSQSAPKETHNNSGFTFSNPNSENHPTPNNGQLTPPQQQQYTQEFYSFQYPSAREIMWDLAIRVGEVVIGAAAVAAGHEIAKFFSRRRFRPAIRQVYEPQNFQSHNPNWWQEKK